MIARHETTLDKTSIWSALAAALPDGVMQWRQDGRVVQRDGKPFARFVGYIDAHFVRQRLDAVVPGEWDLTLDLLPPSGDSEGEAMVAFKARLQILGVIREDVGMGRDYKSASSDAFKRAAVRYGVGQELYALAPNWVQVDGDGRNAKPIEDPSVAYARRYGGGGVSEATRDEARSLNGREAPSATPREAREARETATSAPSEARSARTDAEPTCPKCEGRMFDNRLSKRNPKAPDFKCRDRACGGVIWPERASRDRQSPTEANVGASPAESRDFDDSEIPF